MNNALLSMMGLAKRAGRISAGHDAAVSDIRSRNSKLILIASDASVRLESEMLREKELNKSGVNIIRIKETMLDISRAIPSKAGVISINDSGFAKKMAELIKED